jgi:hypothetical protein
MYSYRYLFRTSGGHHQAVLQNTSQEVFISHFGSNSSLITNKITITSNLYIQFIVIKTRVIMKLLKFFQKVINVGDSYGHFTCPNRQTDSRCHRGVETCSCTNSLKISGFSTVVYSFLYSSTHNGRNHYKNIHKPTFYYNRECLRY